MKIVRYIKENMAEILLKIAVYGVMVLIVIGMITTVMTNMKKKDLPENKFTSEIVEVNGIQYIRDCRYHKSCCEYVLDDCKILEVKNDNQNR